MIEIDLSCRLSGNDGVFPLDVSLRLRQGEMISLFGPSGAGKTCILRMVAGLMKPDTGRIIVNGTTWQDDKVLLPAHKRKVGYVFQDLALFPHLTVLGNIRFALQHGDKEQFISELSDMMNLGGLQQRYPDTLSGGQKQRVALARALARNPEILLLDEPLAALDPETRFEMQEVILAVQRKLQITTILVSHDIPEVYRMSSRIIRLDRGKLVADGRPAQVFGGDGNTSKFRVVGTVVAIEPADVVFLVSVWAGAQMIQVVLSPLDAQGLKPDDHVIVASKAFNPIVIKI